MWCTVVYAFNTLEQMSKLRKDIEDINHQKNGPWFLIRDYNNVLQAQDRSSVTPLHDTEYRNLANMMEKIDLFEKESTGDHFTWYNK